MNESVLERNQERLQNVLKMLVTDTRDFVGQTLAAHPKGQVYIDRLTSHHREHIKDVAAVSQALDPGAYIAVLMAGWQDVFEPLQPPIAVPFALLDKVRRIRNDGYHHNHKLADDGYIEDSLAAVEALRSALMRAARQGARPVSAPSTGAVAATGTGAAIPARRKSPMTSTTSPNDFVDSVEFANNPEPRCSVVLMVDVSSSMNGAPIKALNDGLAAFAREIKQDTVAMMRADVALIEFNHEARVAAEFANGSDLKFPHLTAKGGTRYSRAINSALELTERRKEKYRQNGISYYRSLFYFLTDGYPEHDDPAELEAARARLREAEQERRIACFVFGLGYHADMKALDRIAPKGQAQKLDGTRQLIGSLEWLANSTTVVSNSGVGDRLRLPEQDFLDF